MTANTFQLLIWTRLGSWGHVNASSGKWDIGHSSDEDGCVQSKLPCMNLKYVGDHMLNFLKGQYVRVMINSDWK